MRDRARPADACASDDRARRSSHVGARPCNCVRVCVHRDTHTPVASERERTTATILSLSVGVSRDHYCTHASARPTTYFSPVEYGNELRRLFGQRADGRACMLSVREEREIQEKRDDDCRVLSSGRVSATALKCSRGGRAEEGASDDRPFPFCCAVHR